LMSKETMIAELEKHQLMVAVRTETAEDAYQAALACVNGGIRFIEITFSVPGADEVIKKLVKDGRVTVGAGTVLSVAEAKKALAAGAKYLVAPNFDEDVVAFAKKEGVVSIPGACTPTEIYRAYKAGGDIIKLFPFVEIGGLNFLKALRGPMPFVRCLLSGGANLENLPQYVAAKAAAILIGGNIVKRELVAKKDWAGITGLAKQFVEKVGSAKG
jgi:2-dehydro-3-deoxyphosphogluconate aldolase/(4S)-4-hydroxy-2-oxoglutarate aldolase